MAHEKVLSYAEIKKWNQMYQLEGKDVYQLDAEFTSLVKIQVQELQAEIERISKTFPKSEKEQE